MSDDHMNFYHLLKLLHLCCCISISLNLGTISLSSLVFTLKFVRSAENTLIVNVVGIWRWRLCDGGGSGGMVL
ncbi:hypothetical protein HanRHA438_Chr02g0097431 [Helianthus annuus]|nr:hypothetical protein HanRHA438_Chr02g0097431 [Helianthus annuus]